MDLFESFKAGGLIGKYLTGKESVDDSIQLKNWLNQTEGNKKLFGSLKEEKKLGKAIINMESFSSQRGWEKFKNKRNTLLLKRSLFRWKIAASFLLFISCGSLVAYLTGNKNQIEPFPDSYTLISTNYGQSSRVVLPDSSVVWLNSGSQLSYNTHFSESKRDIKLVGQAFFQISRNEKMPLNVHCNDLNIKVMGTRFDVSAYPNDNKIRVVLESGKVLLNNVDNPDTVYSMKPSEKAVYDPLNRRFSIHSVDSRRYTSWKDGLLIFKNDPMDEVFKRLERWYNIEIECHDDKVKNLVFNATIVNENVEEIFKLIKYTCGIKYRIIASKDPEVPVKITILTN